MPNLDLLLVNPPTRTEIYQELSEFAAIEPPVWAGLIAQYIRTLGYSVAILDAEAEGHGPESTAHIIVANKPRLVVFCVYGHQPSASTQCMPGALAVVAALRKWGKDCPPLMALGTHPSALPAQTLAEGFDFVCQGEGPHTIEHVLYLLKHQVRISKISSHPGLWVKDALPATPAANIINLDQVLPSQALNLLDMGKYRPLWWLMYGMPEGVGGYASVQTSLGCPYACAFCCINAPFGGRGYRMWGAKTVVDQIENLLLNYGISNIKIPDEMFVLNKQHVTAICKEIISRRMGANLNMWAYARVDTVKDGALLALMREAGFTWLGVGVESASKHVRDGVEKGRFGNEEIISAVRHVQSHGLHVGANYIFGLPDDTIESMVDTRALAFEINAEHSNFYCAMAYPGSALHKLAKQSGWKLPEDPGGPGWIGYSQHAYETLPLRTEKLSYEEVLDFRDIAWMRYHTRKEHLDMLANTFGPSAVEMLQRITAKGMPRRAHREREGTPT